MRCNKESEETEDETVDEEESGGLPGPGYVPDPGRLWREGGRDAAEESVNVRVAALKGPTAMGMVKLMSDYAPVEEALEDKENVVTAGGGNTYEFTLAASADEVSPKLMQGEAGHRLRAGQPGLRAV